MHYALSTYESARASHRPDEGGAVTWDDFVSGMAEQIQTVVEIPPDATREQRQDAKVSLPSFAPHEIVDGARRAIENVTAISMVVIDVDDIPAAGLDRMRATLDELGAPWCVYTSPSDPGPDADTRRVRVCVALDSPITTDIPAQCARTRLALAELLDIEPGCGVEQCLDPTRISFMGRLSDGAPREIWSGHHDSPGVPVSELVAVPLVKPWKLGEPKAKAAPKVTAPTPAKSSETVDTLAALLSPSYAEGDRRVKVRALAGWLAGSLGWTDARISALVERLPSDQVPARVALALETAAQARSGKVTAGWAEVRSRFGAATADAAEFVATKAVRDFSAAATTRVKPPARPAVADGIHDWNSPEEPINWLIPGLALAPSEDKISIIGGAPGAGKGPMADYIAVCVATGRPLFGELSVRQTKVGFLDFEGARLTARRMRSHCRGLGLDPRGALAGGALQLRRTSSHEMVDVCANPDSNWLTDWVESEDLGLVVVDSYTSAVAALGLDPNSLDFATLAYALGVLGRLPSAPAVLAVAHSRKRRDPAAEFVPDIGEIAGSGALGAAAATAVSLWRPDATKPLIARIACLRAPDDPFEQREITWVKGAAGEYSATSVTLRTATAANAEAKGKLEIARASAAILEYLRIHDARGAKPLSSAALAKMSGVPGSNGMSAIRELAVSGLIAPMGGGYVVTAKGRGR